MFEVHQPYSLSEPYGDNINSLEMAWQKCTNDRNCVGFTRDHKNSFKLNKNSRLVKEVGPQMLWDNRDYVYHILLIWIFSSNIDQKYYPA